jgi:Nucleoside-diphosphate-sugar pyrophosphorylase involved in lipopolysaccharide biosynthesis/translation initiation factor 2B, gamma/epsilon subunits (eIF-2Bgamma/eIF-2Bepsilon)
MKAVILAAGFGTRLWPLTEDRTKPAIPFLNRPLIAYAVDYLAAHGIRDIIINLHHQPESIRRALGDGSALGVKIYYSFEEEILGTSGAIDRVRDELLDDDFIVINGKIVTDIDLHAAMREHKEHQAIATLVLKENVAREHFSIVEIDGRRRVTHFAGFPEAVTAEATATDAGGGLLKIDSVPLMFTGIQVLSPRIFDYVPRNCFSHSTIHVYPSAIADGKPVVAHITNGNWFEMSTLDRYLEASLSFMRKTGATVIQGAGCAIEPGASVEDAVLWERVHVESGARVRNAVIGDDVRVPADAVIENAVVVRRRIVDEVERGAIIGDNLIVPL